MNILTRPHPSHPQMTLSYEDFRKQLDLFVKLSDRLKDGWVARTQGGVQYLHKSTVTSLNEDTVTCQYDIVHSVPYSVPVLYFTVSKSNGERLALDSIWPYLPCSEQTDNKWSMITGADHPLLSVPYYHIHPCHTNTLMSSTGSESSFYLLTWLSSIGPFVGIKLSLQYHLLFNGEYLNN